MNKEFQNSAGFLQTKPISTESLMEGITPFQFSVKQISPFSDQELEIPEKLMLGKRAERYFSEWINRSSDFELLAENIQVVQDKLTLGEFDFLVRRTSDQQLIHVELVYKFYLFDPAVNGSEFEHWIGPNRGDQLDFKLDKLSNHQFPLLFHPSAKEQWTSLAINPENIEQQVLFLANLFVPIDQKATFNKVNEQAVQGTWMKLSDWEKRTSSYHQFAIPKKKDWFSRELVDAEWFSKDETLDRILLNHAQKRSPLIYSKDENGNHNRYFVVWW